MNIEDRQDSPELFPAPENDSGSVPAAGAEKREKAPEIPSPAAPPEMEDAEIGCAASPKRFRGKIPDGKSFGSALRWLREQNALSLEEVAEQTKLRLSYIRAMEDEDFSSLPQIVFVIAYVRKLGGLYGVDPDEQERLTADLREKLSYDLPDDINKSVVDREFDEENVGRLRRILLLFVLGGILIFLLIGTALTLLITGLSRASSVSEPAVGNDSALVELQTPPELKTTALKL